MKNKITKLKGASKLGVPFYNSMDKVLIFILISLCMVFVLYPVICVIFKSISIDGNISFELYKDIILKNKKLIINSLIVAIISSILSTLIALIVSLYIGSLKNKLKKIYKLLLMVTMISPPFIASLAYIQLFGRRGYITYHLLGLSYDPYGIHGVIIMQVLGFIPLSALMIISVIERVDKRILKASLDLGASNNKTIFKILIPLIKPGIVVSFLLAFVRSLADFGTVTIIGGKLETLSTEIYMEIIGYFNYNNAAALNVLLIIPAILIFIPYRRSMKKLDSISKDNEIEGSNEFRVSITGFSKRILGFIALLFALINVLQYGCILFSSFFKFSNDKLTFTLSYLSHIKEYSFDSFLRSIVYALIVGVFGSLIGIMISYYVERRKILGGKIIDFITTVPYIMPGTFFGISYILAFNKAPLLLVGTAFIVIMNCLFKQIPLTTKNSSAALSQISKEVENAAIDIGASKFHVIKDIILPNMKEAFLIGFINNFTSTMTTIGAVIFLISPGKAVATVELFDAINSGEYGVASIISVIIILITIVVNLLAIIIISRKKER